MSSAKKIGLFACTGVVAGNMMGSGIALLPANLASIGGIAIWGWIISIIGAMSLAYVYARLATKNPQQGGPIAYAGEISPAFGFQTGVLYYHANWIGKASDLFGELTGIAVLLTMLPYFYSCVDLIRFEGVNIRNFVSLICSVLGCVFCFIALMGASSFELAGTFIVSLIILMFYARKMHERQSHSMDNHTASNAH